jgi:SAM-dependent methyltransferase
MTQAPYPSFEFDGFSENYEDALAQGLAVSGEGKEYFAKGRTGWLRYCLDGLQEEVESVLDYGCGDGSNSQWLVEILKAARVIGLDRSGNMIQKAQQKYGTERNRFFSIDNFSPAGQIDLAFCNGVFHHIPVHERSSAVGYIFRSLKPGGLFAFWENNPWNPGTQYVMRRIPFDRNAVTLSPPEARRLLKQADFEILRTDFLFLFPSVLKWLRWIEPSISRLPCGTQYQILGRKPSCQVAD